MDKKGSGLVFKALIAAVLCTLCAGGLVLPNFLNEKPEVQDTKQDTIVEDTIVSASSKSGVYEDKIFSDKVHSLDIQMTDSAFDSLILSALDEEWHPCDIVIDGVLFEKVGIRVKGNTSLEAVYDNNLSRYSFKLKFNKYIKEQTCYGLDEISLNNILADTTYMKEYLAYDMFKYIGAVAPLSSFMDISINGNPWGLYIGVECIDDSFFIRNYGDAKGELYKPEAHDLRYGAQINSDETGDSEIDIKGENLVYIDDNFENYSTVFETVKTNINSTDKVRLIESLKILNSGDNISTVVDIDNTLKYWVVNNFISNFDSYLSDCPHNYYLYERNGVMTLFPWDLNLSFGSYPFTLDGNWTKELDDMTIMVNMPIKVPVNESFKGERPFIEQVVGSYEDLYVKYLNDFIEGYFDSGYFDKKYENTINMILPYIEKDVTCFYDLEDVEQGQKVLKEFIRLRLESVKGQLSGSVDINDESTYIDGSMYNIEDIGHQKGGFVPTKGE